VFLAVPDTSLESEKNFHAFFKRHIAAPMIAGIPRAIGKGVVMLASEVTATSSDGSTYTAIWLQTGLRRSFDCRKPPQRLRKTDGCGT
jgi:hypothetical protein